MPPPPPFLADLQAQGLLSPEQAAVIETHERSRPFSIHYELRALLYFGITLLAGGLGVLVYQNIEHIGHGVIIAFITLIMTACFMYAAKHRQPFTWGEAPRAGLLPDYMLLLGCLTFLILEGYLQYQYNIFGTRYGLVTVLPAALFLWLAYVFDHRGVLSMGLTALGSWVGVNVAPLSAFSDNNFFRYGLGEAAIALGVVLIIAGLVSEHQNMKRIFAFTYLSLGGNVALLAATAALLSDSAAHLPAAVLVLLILVICSFLAWYARRTQSYLFLLMAVIYGYIIVTYLFFQLLDHSDGMLGFLLTVYFPLSAVGAILLFINIKKNPPASMPIKGLPYRLGAPRRGARRCHPLAEARLHHARAAHGPINVAHPVDYYRPNIFLRIGLFIFTCIGALAAAGSVALVTELKSPAAIAIVCGIGAVIALEIAIQSMRHYHSGFDTVALYTALLSFISLLFYIYFESQPSTQPEDLLFGGGFSGTLLLLLIFAVLLVATLRYADRLVTAATYLTYLAVIANVLLHFSAGRLLLPFAAMLAAWATYALSEKARHRPDALYYKSALDVVKLLSLIVFYLGGNYLIVREGNAALAGLPVSTQIPFAPLFTYLQ